MVPLVRERSPRPYAYGLARNRTFVDGNKRSAWVIWFRERIS